MTEDLLGAGSGDGDPGWDHWRDYADGVDAIVEFTTHPMNEPNPEAWVLTPNHAAVWTREWLEKELVDLASTDGCGGHGTYMMTTEQRRTSWGASGAGYQITVTLAESVLSAAAWEAFKAIAKQIARKIRDGGPAPQEGPRGLSEDDAEWFARYRVQLRRGSGMPEDLRLRSVELDDGGGYRVVLLDEEVHVSYDVEVTLVDGSVQVSRIRKISYGMEGG